MTADISIDKELTDTARRRALKALDEIDGITRVLRTKIENADADIDEHDGRGLAAKANDVSAYLAELAVLRDLRTSGDWMPGTGDLR